MTIVPPPSRGRRGMRAIAMAALLALGTVTTSMAHHEALPPDFGTVPSSGDAVKDCGEWADNTEGLDLSDAALAAVERCLDLHGWTYDHEPSGMED